MKRQSLSRVGIILLCGGILLLAAHCKDRTRSDESGKTSSLRYGGVYRKALNNEPLTLDPILGRSIYADTVTQQLFDGLVQFDADLNIVPSIAKSWKASRDGLVWTFELRRGVTFHNGREVTAEDFVYSFTRVMDPKIDSPHVWVFERVKGAKAYQEGKATHIEGLQALDTHTLQIVLSEGYTPFLRMLGVTQAKVVPREEIERSRGQFGRQPIGTGPFRFVKWEPGKVIVLEANEAYFEGRPFLAQIRFPLFPGGDREAILKAFEHTELEEARIAFTMTASQYQRLIQGSLYRFFRKPLLSTLFLWFDIREGPLSRPQVRQAINLAIDREHIIGEIRQHRYVRARGILPPGMPGYNPDLVDYGYNPTRAKELLVEAGYAEGKGLPTLELWSSVISPASLAEHKAIQRNLQHIGIAVELRQATDWKHYATEVLGKRSNALYRYAWHADFPDPDNFLYPLFHSHGNRNYAHYVNAEVDRLLEEARRQNDYLQRLELYRRAEKLVVEDVPTVNLFHYTFQDLFQPYVHGLELTALGGRYIRMKKVWFDTTHAAFPPSTPSN